MACKSCGKNKKVSEVQKKVNKKLTGLEKKLYDHKEKVFDQFLDGTHNILSPIEKIAVTIFGWIPLAIGYFFIIKYLISLF